MTLGVTYPECPGLGLSFRVRIQLQQLEAFLPAPAHPFQINVGYIAERHSLLTQNDQSVISLSLPFLIS